MEEFQGEQVAAEVSKEKGRAAFNRLKEMVARVRRGEEVTPKILGEFVSALLILRRSGVMKNPPASPEEISDSEKGRKIILATRVIGQETSNPVREVTISFEYSGSQEGGPHKTEYHFSIPLYTPQKATLQRISEFSTSDKETRVEEENFSPSDLRGWDFREILMDIWHAHLQEGVPAEPPRVVRRNKTRPSPKPKIKPKTREGSLIKKVLVGKKPGGLPGHEMDRKKAEADLTRGYWYSPKQREKRLIQMSGGRRPAEEKRIFREAQRRRATELKERSEEFRRREKKRKMGGSIASKKERY